MEDHKLLHIYLKGELGFGQRHIKSVNYVLFPNALRSDPKMGMHLERCLRKKSYSLRAGTFSPNFEDEGISVGLPGS